MKIALKSCLLVMKSSVEGSKQSQKAGGSALHSALKKVTFPSEVSATESERKHLMLFIWSGNDNRNFELNDACGDKLEGFGISVILGAK